MRPVPRALLAWTAAAAVAAIAAGGWLGREAGRTQAPELVVSPVVGVDRPAIGDPLPVPAPAKIPPRLPR